MGLAKIWALDKCRKKVEFHYIHYLKFYLVCKEVHIAVQILFDKTHLFGTSIHKCMSIYSGYQDQSLNPFYTCVQIRVKNAYLLKTRILFFLV